MRFRIIVRRNVVSQYDIAPLEGRPDQKEEFVRRDNIDARLHPQFEEQLIVLSRHLLSRYGVQGCRIMRRRLFHRREPGRLRRGLLCRRQESRNHDVRVLVLHVGFRLVLDRVYRRPECCNVLADGSLRSLLAMYRALIRSVVVVQHEVRHGRRGSLRTGDQILGDRNIVDTEKVRKHPGRLRKVLRPDNDSVLELDAVQLPVDDELLMVVGRQGPDHLPEGVPRLWSRAEYVLGLVQQLLRGGVAKLFGRSRH